MVEGHSQFNGLEVGVVSESDKDTMTPEERKKAAWALIKQYQEKIKKRAILRTKGDRSKAEDVYQEMVRRVLQAAQNGKFHPEVVKDAGYFNTIIDHFALDQSIVEGKHPLILDEEIGKRGAKRLVTKKDVLADPDDSAEMILITREKEEKINDAVRKLLDYIDNNPKMDAKKKQLAKKIALIRYNPENISVTEVYKKIMLIPQQQIAGQLGVSRNGIRKLIYHLDSVLKGFLSSI